MCGICGIVKNDGSSVDPERLEKMRDSFAYRGPDDKGAVLLNSSKRSEFIEFKSSNEISGQRLHSMSYDVALAHRRLSIIDLSTAGHQPMCDKDGIVWITYNGEIYNYRQIREVLEARDYLFRSNTDTEVIINAYKEWGAESL